MATTQDELERLRFTPRQSQVIALVHLGLKNKEIGARLGTTENVIKNSLREIYDQLGLWNRVELALWYEVNVYEPSLLRASPAADSGCPTVC